jgi:RNA polymerase sigma factor (sigma-70 family)
MNLETVQNRSAFAIMPTMNSSDRLAAPLTYSPAEQLDIQIGLVTAIANGDEQAFGAFYDATIGRVFGLALRIVRRRDVAEEVAEDAYMQVWQQASRFDASRGKPLSWLLTICRTRALDYLRRKDDALVHPAPETLHAEPYDERADPQDLLLATEQNSHLHDTLNSLLPIQRQLLGLAFFRGLTHREIATHVQLPLGTVKSHVRNALNKLREQLAEIE